MFAFSFGWLTPLESRLLHDIAPPPQKKDCECSKVNSEMFPSKTCLGPKKKLLAVDPEEAASTRVGAVEYFMANTVFLPNRSTNEEQLKSKPSNSQQGRHMLKRFLSAWKVDLAAAPPPALETRGKTCPTELHSVVSVVKTICSILKTFLLITIMM